MKKDKMIESFGETLNRPLGNKNNVYYININNFDI